MDKIIDSVLEDQKALEEDVANQEITDAEDIDSVLRDVGVAGPYIEEAETKEEITELSQLDEVLDEMPEVAFEEETAPIMPPEKVRWKKR